MPGVRREMLASMVTPQYRISLLFWLMIMVAVSAALAGISKQFLFMVVAFWISMITALICLRPLKMGFGLTSLLCVLVMDLCCASLCALGSPLTETRTISATRMMSD
jgi:hypothetical protein